MKVPLDPFEKDATTELDTFKETLGGAQKIHERYTPGSTNIAGWTRIEDVFPIKNVDIPFHRYVSVPEGR